MHGNTLKLHLRYTDIKIFLVTYLKFTLTGGFVFYFTSQFQSAFEFLVIDITSGPTPQCSFVFIIVLAFNP